MTTIVTRAGKGSPLTWNEVDNNFTNLNSAKYESGNNASFGTISGTTITASSGFSGALNGTVGATTPAAGTFTNLAYTGTLTGGTGVVNLGSGQFYKDASGNVGVGTASPASTLDVVGVVRSTLATPFFELISGSTTTGGLYSPDTNSVNLLARSGKSLIFLSGGAIERMRIDTSGNVGIGTSSPAVTLDVGPASGTTSNSVIRINGGGSAGYGPQLRFASAGTQNATLGTDQSIFGGSSTDFSIYVPTANNIRFYTNGSNERMRIDSSGNVGIGTSSPSYKLDVAGQIASQDAYLITANSSGTPSAGAFIFRPASNTIALGTASTERMRIDSSGNVGIGTSTTTDKLNIAAANSQVRLIDTDDSTYCQFSYSSNALALRINSISADHFYFQTTGEFWVAKNTDAGAYNIQCGGTGVWGAGAYVNGSDARIKEEITPIASSLDVVSKLNPVTYKYKEDWSKDRSTQTGFIAQELLEALDGQVYVDGVVQQGGADNYYSVAYQNIIPILTKAIQELKAELDAVKTELNNLKGN